MLKNFWQHKWSTLGGLLVALAQLSVNGMTLKQFAIAGAIQLLGGLAQDPQKK